MAGLLVTAASCFAQNKTTELKSVDISNELNLTQEWDKTFPKSSKVETKKVTFQKAHRASFLLSP